MITPHEYYLSVIGKTIDMDKAYGGQCWDLYAHYMKTLGYKYANCTTSGYVKDIWNNRKTNGMLDSCIEVSVNELQDGDIVVYGECDACPKSHIAIFRKDNGNNTIVLLGQNQSGQFVDQKTFTKNGIIGVFRPKCYVKASEPSTPATNDSFKHTIGETVRFTTCYRSSTDAAAIKNYVLAKNMMKDTGKITKQLKVNGVSTYLLDSDLCWVNDGDIAEVVGESSTSSEIKVGDKVTPTSRYSYNGVFMIKDVLEHKYTVTEIEGDRVVLGDGLNTAFKMSDLKK